MEVRRLSDICSVDTPCYVVDRSLLEKNLETLDHVQRRTGAKILLALKGFAMWSTFPLVSKYLAGVCASSPNEARLGREEFGKEVHAFASAYSQSDVQQLAQYADHIVFNSFGQWERYKADVKNLECGLRVNPEYSEIRTEIYNPCAKYSRLGIRAPDFEGMSLEGISGLHFHAMCEQNSDTLHRIVNVFDRKFAERIKEMEWINFGGGHHITRPDYDIDLLCDVIDRFLDKYDVQLYLEPGEAIALNTGVLVSTVLDVVDNGMKIAILDTSAEAHMPDVLAMPYRPNIVGGGRPGEKGHTYRLGGVTCLAGDIIGDYSFDHELKVGDKVVLEDMAHYTMVKNTTFNGIRLPSIAILEDDGIKVVREFGYEDYKGRI